MGSSSMPETDSKEKRAGLHSGYFGPFSHGRCCRQTKYSSAEPAEPGEVRKSGYKRHGTTTLFAAFNILNGKVIGNCLPRHRGKEFIKFLNQLETEVPPELDIHL